MLYGVSWGESLLSPFLMTKIYDTLLFGRVYE